MTDNLTLRRLCFTPDSPTMGVLMNGDKPMILIAERPWLNNAENISCIPPGTYLCVPHNTPDKPQCWEITGVPNRTNVLIHAGNDPMVDSEGCQLTGTNFYPGGVGESQNALSYLRAQMKWPQQFMLEIVNP